MVQSDELLSKLRKDSTTGKGSSKMEKYTIPEIATDEEWLYLTGQTSNGESFAFNPIKPEQILLIDVFSAWSGPCGAMEGHLRRMRLSFVETPDALALAKACCDNIEALKSFQSDPRPIFLFWARGKPVALLRGANRPLLTRLIEQEVRLEAKGHPRDEMEIDFKSDQVIQCQGDLARLAEDEVVHSIGSGLTDKLTSFFVDQPVIEARKKISMAPKAESPPDILVETNETEKPLDADSAQPNGHQDPEDSSPERQQSDEENHDPNAGEADVEPMSEAEVDPEQEESEAELEEGVEGFGKKKTKSGKKPQTGLLKEILNAKSQGGGRR